MSVGIAVGIIAIGLGLFGALFPSRAVRVNEMWVRLSTRLILRRNEPIVSFSERFQRRYMRVLGVFFIFVGVGLVYGSIA